MKYKENIVNEVSPLKILLIEDDQSIFELVLQRLEQWGFTVEGVNDFHTVMDDYRTYVPDLVMIDIQLPAFDGFHWCREIRAVSNVPILFLSSRDHPMDMVMAMQMGADDFVQKPFHMDVLIAKIQAILRRTYDYKEQVNSTIEWQGAIIDYDRALVSYNGMHVELTKNELFILKALLTSGGQIVSRDEMMRKLWNDDRFVNDNTLTVNVNRLRQRLEDIGLVDVIVTKKGLGYMAVMH